MKLYTKYTTALYLKWFFIIFISLEMFYVGVDTLTNLKNIQNSANLKLLYMSLTAVVAVNYTLPLSLVLALISSKISMIRNNELVSLYALGIHKNAVIIGPFIASLIITLIYILLCMTPFIYAKEYQMKLADRSISYTNNIFLKYENKFIYIKELFPASNSANVVEIFDIADNKLTTQISAKKAEFSGDKWILHNAVITNLPSSFSINQAGYTTTTKKDIETLNNFKPKIINKIYQADSFYSILDAFESIIALKSESVNITKIKSILYSLIFFPFFAPIMVLILYYYMPVTGRFFNITIISSLQILIAVCLWGILFVMTKFSTNGVIIPELGVIAPILLLLCFAFFKFYKNT